MCITYRHSMIKCIQCHESYRGSLLYMLHTKIQHTYNNVFIPNYVYRHTVVLVTVWHVRCD